MTPYDKLSKKDKKEINKKRRNVWSICPITRKTNDRKTYNRKSKHKKRYEEE